MVAQNKSNSEEGYTQKHSNTSDQMDEMVDFFGNGSFTGVQTWRQTSDTTHYSVVTTANNDSFGSACRQNQTIY